MSDRGAFEICYEMSDDFLDLARKRYQAKYYGWSLLGLAVLGPPVLLFLWFGPMGRVFAGITTGALGMLGIIWVTIQIMAKQNRRVFREKYQIRSVVFRMTEEGVGFKAAWGSAQLPWSSFRNIWWFKDVVLLFTSRIAYLPIPMAGLTSEAAKCLKEKLTEKHNFFPGP